MATEWYVSLGGVERGPFTSSRMEELARAGEITPDTAVKKGAVGAWMPAGKAGGLFEAVEPLVQPEVVPASETAVTQPAQHLSHSQHSIGWAARRGSGTTWVSRWRG